MILEGEKKVTRAVINANRGQHQIGVHMRVMKSTFGYQPLRPAISVMSTIVP